MTVWTMKVELGVHPCPVECVFIGETVNDDSDYQLYHPYADQSDLCLSAIKAIKSTSGNTKALLGEDDDIKDATIVGQIPWKCEEEIYMYINEINNSVASLNIHGSINDRYNFDPKEDDLRILLSPLQTAIDVEKRQGRWSFDVVEDGRCSRISNRGINDRFSNKFSKESEMMILGDEILDSLKPSFSPGIPVLEFV